MTDIKSLSQDTDGMATYDYLVNHVPDCLEEMDYLTDNLLKADTTGQFLASSARFLSSVDKDTFHRWIYRLIDGAIDKDRERRYIWSLLEAVWGPDYMERADELKKSDDNFRRVFKRVYTQHPGVKVTI